MGTTCLCSFIVGELLVCIASANGNIIVTCDGGIQDSSRTQVRPHFFFFFVFVVHHLSCIKPMQWLFLMFQVQVQVFSVNLYDK